MKEGTYWITEVLINGVASQLQWTYAWGHLLPNYTDLQCLL